MEFIEISIKIIQKFNKVLHFDVYVKRASDEYTKIFQKGDTLDKERVKIYLDKGINYFYVTEKDYQIYSMFIERLGETIASSSVQGLSENDAHELIKELTLFTMNEMTVKLNIDERTVTNAGNIVNSAIGSLKKDPKSLIKILTLMVNQPYIIKHSIAVSLFSVMLAKKSGIESESMTALIGLGGFLHDVGVGQLTFDPEDIEVLTPQQRKEVWKHPELGMQQLDSIKGIRTEVIQIVIQHHEQPNGSGYPNYLKNNEIFPPAKIVSIADSFSSMITKRSFRDAFSTAEALANMRNATGKYDEDLLRTFTDIFIKR